MDKQESVVLFHQNYIILFYFDMLRSKYSNMPDAILPIINFFIFFNLLLESNVSISNQKLKALLNIALKKKFFDKKKGI
jgi:hypothetical protein